MSGLLTRRKVLGGVVGVGTVTLAGCVKSSPESTHCESGCHLLEKASVHEEESWSTDTDYELRILFDDEFTGEVIAKVYTPEGAFIEAKENRYEGVRSVTFAFNHQRAGDVTLRYEAIPDE